MPSEQPSGHTIIESDAVIFVSRADGTIDAYRRHSFLIHLIDGTIIPFTCVTQEVGEAWVLAAMKSFNKAIKSIEWIGSN